MRATVSTARSAASPSRSRGEMPMAVTHDAPPLDERYESEAASAPKTGVKEPRPNWVRTHALRRRMLATADALALLISCAVLLGVGSIAPELALSLGATMPLWVLTAKLLQLYDRDDHSLRHLTADEAAIVAIWAIVSTACASVL